MPLQFYIIRKKEIFNLFLQEYGFSNVSPGRQLFRLNTQLPECSLAQGYPLIHLGSEFGEALRTDSPFVKPYMEKRAAMALEKAVEPM